MPASVPNATSHPERQLTMAWGAGSWPPVWKTWIEFLAPAPSTTDIRGMIQQMSGLCLCFCPSETKIARVHTIHKIFRKMSTCAGWKKKIHYMPPDIFPPSVLSRLIGRTSSVRDSFGKNTYSQNSLKIYSSSHPHIAIWNQKRMYLKHFSSANLS